jgi:hypothetical protein
VFCLKWPLSTESTVSGPACKPSCIMYRP